jgi:osmotically-inducible protein OsmY
VNVSILRPRILILGAASAAAAYFLDPQNGKRRRHIARDKAFSYVRQGGQEVARKADYAAGVAKGAAYEAAPTTGSGDAAERLNDPALARKVESEIFRAADVPKGDVVVNVEDGVVYLRGQVPDEGMIERLVTEAGEVDGVQRVESLLHAAGSPAPKTAS